MNAARLASGRQAWAGAAWAAAVLVKASRVAGDPFEVALGLGLVGTKGAITWLSLTFGSVAVVLATYFILKKGFEQHRLLVDDGKVGLTVTELVEESLDG